MNLIKLTFILVSITASCVAHAQDGGGYANLFFGLSVPDSANTSLHGIYGFTGGSRVSEKISLGGYHAQSSQEKAVDNAPFSFSMTGLETRVNIVSGDTNVYVSLRAGVTKVNTEDSGNEVIFSPYHFGIVSGYNIKFWTRCSMGFEGSYVEIEDSKAFSGGSDLIHPSFHTINFFGTFGLLF